MLKKKVSIVVLNLSGNSLARTYPIAKTLSKKFDIEIIGVLYGDSEVYYPYKKEFNFKIIRKKRKGVYGFLNTIFSILKSIDGDIIYAFKPKLMSFGLGLIAKFYKRKPLILDIEDLETADWTEKSLMDKLKLFFSRFDSHNEFVNFLMEKLIFLSNENIVVSENLKKRYGGTKIIHGVDIKLFNPKKFNKDLIKEKLKLRKDHKYILFSGTPREHKGLEELLKAIKNINNDNLKLLLVGGDSQDSFYCKLLSIGENIIVPVGEKDHEVMPEYLSASDMVVLPQRETLFANAQVPAKVFEAMAMEKPIISTNISDMKEILDSCGIIIDPIKNTSELEIKIKLLINDDNLSRSLGKMARIKCINEYSWERMAEKLFPIFEKL